MQLQLGEERDALIQHTLEQSQDLEGRRGALTPSSPWVRAGPAGRGTPPLRGVTAWLSLLPAVSVPAELHQQVARESQGLPRELEEKWERYRSLEQEYENLRDEVAFLRVRAWPGNRSLQATPSLAPRGEWAALAALLCGRSGFPSSSAGGPQPRCPPEAVTAPGDVAAEDQPRPSLPRLAKYLEMVPFLGELPGLREQLLVLLRAHSSLKRWL